MSATTFTVAGPDTREMAVRPVYIRLWAPQSIIYLVAGLHAIFAESISDGLRNGLAGIVGVYLIVAAIMPTVRRKRLAVDAAGIAMLISIIALSFANLFVNDPQAEDYLISMVRALTGVAAICYFARTSVPVLPKVKLLVYAAATAAAVLLTLQHGLYDYAGVLRPQPFAGLDAIHSSAYVISAGFIGVVLMRLQGEIGRITAWLFGLPLFALLIAYQVRTTWVMVLVFFASVVGLKLYAAIDRRTFTALLGAAMAMMVMVVPVLLVFVLPGLDLDTFSSGRTATYLERFDILMQRSPSELFFGTGLGSDSFYSSSWWLEPKDSHNDFLHVVIEQGLVSLAALGAIFAFALYRANIFQAAVLLSFISGSAISNALLDRPMFAILHLGLLAAAVGPRTSRLHERLTTARTG